MLPWDKDQPEKIGFVPGTSDGGGGMRRRRVGYALAGEMFCLSYLGLLRDGGFGGCWMVRWEI